MEKFEHVKCAVCDSENLDQITKKGQFGFPTFVCICKNCGLSFLNPRWDQASYQDFYGNKYDNYYRTYKNTKPPKTDPVSYYPIIYRLNSTFESQKKFKNILDIGSGDGSKLDNFIQDKMATNYFAIEPSIAYKEKLIERGIQFVDYDVDSDWDKAYQNHFDFIIMRHVLEHCLDPIAVLEKLKNVLTDDGVLYIAVPNSFKPKQSLTDSFFRVVHTYYFNKISLKNILNKVGFKTISMEEGDQYHSDELFVFSKKSKLELELEIKKDNYNLQKEIFENKLKKERLIDYKIKRILNQVINSIVKIKKSIFPKPIFKK